MPSRASIDVASPDFNSSPINMDIINRQTDEICFALFDFGGRFLARRDYAIIDGFMKYYFVVSIGLEMAAGGHLQAFS